MVKRSRHRRPLLSPLPLPRHWIRACQIRLLKSVLKNVSSPSKNQRRLRSPVTPCCSSQTLTWSKVESTSMSDKCEIRSLGGPGDIADRNVDEVKVNTAQASGPSSPPPSPDFSTYPDEFKSLGPDRLRPPGDSNDPCDLQQYKDYLESFYNLNKGPCPVTSVADAAFLCLEKENHMTFWWGAKAAVCCAPELFMNLSVLECMFAAADGGDESLPFGVDAALCIAKEAELITEWLKRRGRFLTNDEYVLCCKIRVVAYLLFVFEGNWSTTHIAAALLGIRKEAERLIENLRLGSDESITTSMKIRQSALDFIWQMVDEYQSYMIEGSSEMASESDDNDTSIEEETKWY